MQVILKESFLKTSPQNKLKKRFTGTLYDRQFIDRSQLLDFWGRWFIFDIHLLTSNLDQCGKAVEFSDTLPWPKLKTEAFPLKNGTARWVSCSVHVRKTWFKHWDTYTPLRPSVFIHPWSPVIAGTARALWNRVTPKGLGDSGMAGPLLRLFHAVKRGGSEGLGGSLWCVANIADPGRSGSVEIVTRG